MGPDKHPPFNDAVSRHRVILRETYVIPTGISREIRGKESAGKVLRKVGLCGIPIGTLWESYGRIRVRKRK